MGAQWRGGLDSFFFGGGALGSLISGVGGTERGVTCHQQSAPQSTAAAYIQTPTHTVLREGTRTWLFQSVKGAGSGCGGTGRGVPLPETRVGLKHALWAATYHCTAGGV